MSIKEKEVRDIVIKAYTYLSTIAGDIIKYSENISLPESKELNMVKGLINIAGSNLQKSASDINSLLEDDISASQELKELSDSLCGIADNLSYSYGCDDEAERLDKISNRLCKIAEAFECLNIKTQD